MANQSQLDVFFASLPQQQQLFEAAKKKDESLAQWAVRLSRLGKSCGFTDVIFLDTLLRDKFIFGLDSSRIKTYLEQLDYKLMTNTQILDAAFTNATKFDKEQKALLQLINQQPQ